MIYKATTQRHYLWFVMLLVILGVPLNLGSLPLVFAHLAVIIFILVGLLLKFELTMDEQSIQYQIKIFTRPLYQKQIFPQDIRQITFRRVGWTKRGAVIQVKKGRNVRVIDFSPNTMMADLLHFAMKHHIHTEQTKEFIMLHQSHEKRGSIL